MTYWQIMILFKGGKGWGFCPKMQGLGTGRNAFRWTDFWFKRPDFGNLGRFWLIRGPCFFVSYSKDLQRNCSNDTSFLTNLAYLQGFYSLRSVRLLSSCFERNDRFWSPNQEGDWKSQKSLNQNGTIPQEP